LFNPPGERRLAIGAQVGNLPHIFYWPVTMPWPLVPFSWLCR